MELRKSINELMDQARTDLAELVAIRSVADPRQFPPEECARAAEWVREKFAQVGFVDLRLEQTIDGSQAVYGRRPGAGPTVRCTHTTTCSPRWMSRHGAPLRSY